jgi:hypothetical protein
VTNAAYRYAPAPPQPPPRQFLVPGNVRAASRPLPMRAREQAVGAVAVRPYPATRLPAPFEHQVMSRLSWGLEAGTWAAIRACGGPKRWFAQQLLPEQVPDPRGDAVDGWYGDRMTSAADKWAAVFAGTKFQWEYAVDLANWSLLRRSSSTRQLLEVMTDFWSNHFHIPAIDDLAWSWRNQYDALLRAKAFGRFDDLLVSVSLHPAMRLYLGNYESTKDVPNENQGRELLELHTVGLDSGYTEDMVKDSARILTGYTVNAWEDWLPYYDPTIHATGAVRVLGFTAANARARGQTVATDYLRYLAHHPSTARTIARKLALRFVSDDPSDQLVSDLAARFTSSGTDITATLEALIQHPEFASSQQVKVRNPIEDFVATVRTLGVSARQAGAEEWPFASAQIWMCQGQYPFQWPRPDGLPQTNDSWCSASQVLGSLDLHYSLSGGWVGDVGTVDYRTPLSWLPQPQLRFDSFVDHLCRTLLGQPSTVQLLTAACEATGCAVAEQVNADHALVQWLMPRLLTTILDTPAHMSH